MNNTDRLMRIVENDGDGALKRTLGVVRSDILDLLTQFMDVKRLNMEVRRENGAFALIIDADVARFYDIGKTTEWND